METPIVMITPTSQCFLKGLKEEMAKLKALSTKSDAEKLIGIYETFPPKNKSHKLKEKDPKKLEGNL